MRQRTLGLAFLLLVACTREPPPSPPLVANASACPPPAPTDAGVPASGVEIPAIDEAVRGAIDRGEVPGAVVFVVHNGRVLFHRAYGLRRKEPAEEQMTEDTVFDLASLTKALVTAPCVLLLAERGKLRLADPVARYLPAFAAQGKGSITVEQLLLHTGGLVADNPLADYAGGREKALATTLAEAPKSAPGEEFLYSDVGFVVLGALVEKVAGEPLDVFARKNLFEPLAMGDTAFNPSPSLAARAAPTERREGRMLAGEVHDPRAHLLGGVAGHAGLFSTGAGLARFASMLLDDGAPVLKPSTFRLMTAPHEVPGGGKRALGWDVQTGFSGPRGELRGGFGHTGFTGTSMWIDPGSRVGVIVLTSRLHPDGKGDPRRLRREVATAVARSPSVPRVLTGIDVLERDGMKQLAGRRVGLVTNSAGVDRKGVSTIDAIRGASGVTLVALFSPEHGIRGRDDGAVADRKDERTGLPVYSLYGPEKRPTAEQLRGIDTLVYDLQDVGARFYTYLTTLGYLLETAAEHHIQLVVLDRPNPIGGLAVEGPVLDAGLTSFVGYHPLPVRHGMTVGELARLFRVERHLEVDLGVVKIEGWSRAETLDRTDLVWRDPSPNLRSVDEALLYPGVALLEATNLSVGRGTARPFELIGAPFVDGATLAAALGEAGLAGVRFSAESFTPAASTFAGKRCGGVKITVEHRARFEPVRTGMAIALALARLYPKEWESKNVLTLLGNREAFVALGRGEPLDRIVAGWQPGLKAFLDVRRRHLLYPPD